MGYRSPNQGYKPTYNQLLSILNLQVGYVGDCKGNVGILIDTRYPFTGDYLGFRGFVGDEILYTQLNGYYFINHYEDHVFKQPVFHGKYPAGFFFVAQMILGCLPGQKKHRHYRSYRSRWFHPLIRVSPLN